MLMPWLDKTRLGPQMVAAYFQPYFINVLPNLLFLTAIFFALAALTRKMLPVYVAGVLVLIGYFAVAQNSAATDAPVCAGSGSIPWAATLSIASLATGRPSSATRNSSRCRESCWRTAPCGWAVGAIFLIVTYVKFCFAYPAEAEQAPAARGGRNRALRPQNRCPSHTPFSPRQPRCASCSR